MRGSGRAWKIAAPTIAAVLAAPCQVHAEAPTWPVIVTSVGPQRLRVRVAAGYVQPCSSSSNRMLFEGPLEPGESVSLGTPSLPICVEHTYGAFPDTDWSVGAFFPNGRCGRGPCRPPPVVRVFVSSNPG